MNCCDLHLTVREEDPITLEIVEAVIKPEQTKSITPTYAKQTVLPDPGMTLGSVTVEPIPDPTERLEITENGEYDVARIGTVNVDVPVPPGYVYPQGTLEIVENGTGIDVREKAFVDVAVPIPVMPEEYCVGGSLSDGSLTAYVFSPNLKITNFRLYSQFMGCRNMTKVYNLPSTLTQIKNGPVFRDCINLESLGGELPNGITLIGGSAFAECRKLILTKLPFSLVTVETSAFFNCGKVTFSEMPIGVTTIDNQAFVFCSGITEMTFKGTPTTIHQNAFYRCDNLLQIYVPWSEGAVANAPWGATNATITYDYVGA